MVAAEIAHERPCVANLIGIETCGRLVQHQDRRTRYDGVGQSYALPIAFRQVPNTLVRDVDHARLADRVVDLARTPGARNSLELRPKAEVLDDAHFRIQRDRLRHVT